MASEDFCFHPADSEPARFLLLRLILRFELSPFHVTLDSLHEVLVYGIYDLPRLTAGRERVMVLKGLAGFFVITGRTQLLFEAIQRGHSFVNPTVYR